MSGLPLNSACVILKIVKEFMRRGSMKSQNVRVLLASEFPGTRSILRRIVENENKAVIIGEAENCSRALNLARTLHPDVALIDSHLPSIVGIDSLPLSRVGGLDVAQSISDAVPDTRVVLLNSLSSAPAGETGWSSEATPSLCQESRNTCIPFKLEELPERAALPGSLIFANIEIGAQTIPLQQAAFSDKVVLTGVIGIIAGWLMILTMFLSTIGLYFFVAGVTVGLFGIAGKLFSRVFHHHNGR
jgi:CheY-like chemotaxis protein